MSSNLNAGRIKRIAAMILLFAPASLLVVIGTRKCEHKFTQLEDYGKVAPFSFVNAMGDTIDSKDLDGKILLITTLQPNCLEDCAISWWHFDELIYEGIYTNKKKLGDFRIISFVTDENGNPSDDLADVNDMLYDKIEGYDPNLWMIAKGDAKPIFDIEHEGRKLLVNEETGEVKNFTEFLLLVDKKGHLRIVRSGKQEGMIRDFQQHMALLMKQYDKEKARKK